MPVVALSIFHIDPFHGRAFFGKNSPRAKNRRLALVTHAPALELICILQQCNANIIVDGLGTCLAV